MCDKQYYFWSFQIKIWFQNKRSKFKKMTKQGGNPALVLPQGQMQGQMGLPHDEMKYMEHSNNMDHMDEVNPSNNLSPGSADDDVIKREQYSGNIREETYVKQEVASDVRGNNSPGSGLRLNHSGSSLTSPEAKHSAGASSSKNSYGMPPDGSSPTMYHMTSQPDHSHMLSSDQLPPTSASSPFQSPWQPHQQRHEQQETDIHSSHHSMTPSPMPYPGMTSQDYMAHYHQPHHLQHHPYMPGGAAVNGSHSNTGYYSAWQHYNSQFPAPPHPVFNSQQYVT